MMGYLTCEDQISMISLISSLSLKLYLNSLIKTTRIIHHNQLLFTKFGKNLRHIESMTSKVERTENY